MDPFAVTLTTGLACIDTDRTCIRLETHQNFISYSKTRALDFAKSTIKDRVSQVGQDPNQRDLEIESGVEILDVANDDSGDDADRDESEKNEETDVADSSGSGRGTCNRDCDFSHLSEQGTRQKCCSLESYKKQKNSCESIVTRSLYNHN